MSLFPSLPPFLRPTASRRPRLPLLAWMAALTFAAGASAAPVQHGELRMPQSRIEATKAVTGAHDDAEPVELGTVRVQSSLMKRLDAGERQDYVIELKARADLSKAAGMDWTQRGRHVVEQLRTTAERSQASLRRDLARQGIAFEPHWIKNVILVRNGDAASLRTAAAHPGVARIRDLPQAKIVEPQPGKPQPKAAAGTGLGVADNIAWIGADQAWAQGTRGHGVTVGVIDTGAYYTHNALRRQYRGWRGGDSYEHDYNWYYPGSFLHEPVSADPHGSHVIGTITGDDLAADPALRNRIGVAPGAQWIACLGLTVDGNNAASLLSCGEFMLAPTRTDGSDPDPDQRPQVINNSWSEQNCNGEATSFYADVVDAWVASGIFPVFAAGNAFSCGLPEPPGLSSVSSPASLAAAFAVGSTGNHDGAYATHSLWGPSAQASPGGPTLPDPRGHPQLKPQVVAPGVDIISAYVGHEDDYGRMSGTSMSAPHIAGLVALMLEAGECLVGDYAALGTLVMSTARPLPYATGGLPAPGPGDVPNYATGWGEIDAAAAVNAAAAACGPQGFVAGHVTNSSGDPIGGARIELFVDETVRVWELYSEPDGSYIRRLPENLAGGYSIRVTAYGYLAGNDSGITVADGQTTPVDMQLATAPLATVQGRVTDAATGWPLHARLRIAGLPDGALWTDAATGLYSVELPQGAEYRVDVDSDVPGYLPLTQQVMVNGPLTQDFALAADPTACAAPGYGYTQQLVTEDFETGTPPTGWSTSSAGEGWLFGTHAELHQPNHWPIAPRDGRFAATMDPAGLPGAGNDGRYDYLVSPPIDLTTATNPVVRFDSLFWSGSFLSTGAYVQASIDDGATWQPVGTPLQDMNAWHTEAMSLAAFAGQTVRLRFHYDDGSSDEFDMVNPGWAVDDVAVVAACTAPATGGLVVGRVLDANTGDGLDGALVSDGVGDVVTATSDDPALGAGFFALWTDSGSATITATRGTQPAGYGDDQETFGVGVGTTHAVTLELPAGLLAFAPAAGPSATLELGTVASVPFTLRNDGTLPLDYAFEGQSLEEHFDDGFPPAGWTLTDNGQGCPWNLSLFGNTAGGDGEAAGVYPFNCWGMGRLDNSMVLPPVDLSQSQSASLGFFLSFYVGPDADPRLDVEVSTNAGTTWTSIFTQTTDTFEREPFNLVELDLADYAGEPDVRIRFRYRSTPPWGYLQVDQVHVFRELGVDDPLAISPAPDMIAAGAQIDASAEFDATRVAQPGTYVIPVRVVEDTPYAYPYGELTGTMTVTAPASWGSVAGTVRSLGRCEADPQAIANQPVRIVAAGGEEVTTHTDADGHYRYWLDSAHGPYAVRVDADAHAPAQRQVTVSAGAETTADIDARPLAACVVPDPTALQVALDGGASTTRALDLLNLGAASGDYSARVGGDPGVPTPLRLTQNTSSVPEQYWTIGCFDPNTGYVLENRWYRVYPLAERGLSGDSAWIDGVRFGADAATSAAGQQAVHVSVYALSGAFVRDNLTLLATVQATVADTDLAMLDVAFPTPVQVALDEVIVVEIAVPDGAETATTFYPAGNSAPDTAPAYFESAACGVDEPITYDDFGFEGVSPVIELDIRASDPCGPTVDPVQWLGITPTTGNVPADGATTLQAAVDAGTLAPGGYRGAVCITAAGPSDVDAVVPVNLDVEGELPPQVFANGFE